MKTGAVVLTTETMAVDVSVETPELCLAIIKLKIRDWRENWRQHADKLWTDTGIIELLHLSVT